MLGGWVAAASLVIVEFEALEATVFITFIGFIVALDLTVTTVSSSDTRIIGALPLIFLAATDSAGVLWELLEAALFLGLIRAILALRFSVTVLVGRDTLAGGASELRFRVAATDLGGVEAELSEAALIFTLI
jgi:hypothetical protein